MSKHHERSIPLFLFGLGGLLISSLTGAFENLPSLQFLCSVACGETAQIVLFGIPIWAWGSLFWAAVALLAWFNRKWMPWFAAPAIGVELALIWIMYRMEAPCLFCIANAALVFMLLFFSATRKLIWQQAALALLFLIAAVGWIPHENRLFASEPGAGAGIVARVGDEAITDQRLEVLLGPKLFDLKREMYRLKKEKLDQLIIEAVLQKEAKAKGLTIEQLLEQAVPASRFTTTEQEIDKYLQENHERVKEWTGPIQELRSRIKFFLNQQKRAQEISAYARTLDEQYGVQVFLPVPRPPTVSVDLSSGQSQGPPDAPVTVVEFSDYECPACRSTHETTKKVKEAYGNQLRWIFKDYPLRRHKEAFKAAEAANCAADQGKFWEYQDIVFARDKLDFESLVKYSGELGLSTDKFRQCLQEQRHKAGVEKSIQDANLAGVDRTPSFIINGVLMTGGLTFETFKAKIDEELKNSQLKKDGMKKQERNP